MDAIKALIIAGLLIMLAAVVLVPITPERPTPSRSPSQPRQQPRSAVMRGKRDEAAPVFVF